MALTKIGKEGITGISNSSDATAITIDSSENVGIGNTTPSSFYSLADNLVVGTGSGGHGLTIYSGSSDSGYIGFNDTASASMQGFIQYNHNGDYMAFAPNGSERMRITSAGYIDIGTINHSSTSMLDIASPNLSGTAATISLQNNTDNTGGYFVAFYRSNNSLIGNISQGSGSVAYNTTSDHRVKENVEDMTGAIDRVKQLLPKRFNFIEDETDTLVDGFLAHEAQSVVAEAVTGTHNEVDDDGNPVMQGIDQSKLVPLLTGALKEAIAKIEALETRITALENA